MKAPPNARHSPIRILAPAEETGDLFTRLVSDLFLALGYNQPHLNIHKAGREIDVEAEHRWEIRRVVAECKATGRPIGGADINKFAGLLDAERRESAPTEGYFISLSGFTETALKQEKAIKPPRMTLLDGQQIVEALVQGRIVKSLERALERAGHCAARARTKLVPEERPQLLAHKIGWIWAIRFHYNVEVTHVALIHADGEALASRLAYEVLEVDRIAQGGLHGLKYLPPEDPEEEEALRLTAARRRYFAYLEEQCGELESLPANQEMGLRKWQLEDLLVPLHLEPIQPALEKPTRLPAGQALKLKQRARLFVHSTAGGGKTTLLKWLAVAYAFPERRGILGNGLPDRDWFPLLLRCREIKHYATEPIITLLARLGERCEMFGDLANAFQSLLHSVLREGRALLLVDGIDEIGNTESIIDFVSHLRTFLSIYPGVDVVVTAREAGFRAVAGELSNHCDHYRISDFDRADVERFTVAWHRGMIGDHGQAEQQAHSLTESIWETDQLRRLAANPLLLMNLLHVQSQGEELPRQSAMLYEKAIELLLEWNIKGFERLDVQEMTAQLAFLAWQMKEEGILRIPVKRLRKILQAARKQMSEVLANAPLSVVDFVKRVERGLMASGRDNENGRSVPVYEFWHSMFQDYLVAKALVDGYYPDRKESDSLVSKLEPHLEDEAWKEVIPLVAGLAGSAAQPLIEALVSQVEFIKKRDVGSCSVSLLARCLLEEVQIPPALVERALDALARVQPGQLAPQLIRRLAASRRGDIFRDLVWREFTEGTTDLQALSWVVLVMGWLEPGWPPRPDPNPERIQEMEALLQQGESRNRALGLLMVSWLASQLAAKPEEELRPGRAASVARLVPSVLPALDSAHLWEQFSGVLSLGWLARAEAVSAKEGTAVAQRLSALSLSAESTDLREAALWALLGIQGLLDQPGVDRHDKV